MRMVIGESGTFAWFFLELHVDDGLETAPNFMATISPIGQELCFDLTISACSNCRHSMTLLQVMVDAMIVRFQ